MNKVLLICLSIVFTLPIGCKRATVTEPGEESNLIRNSSFESEAGPSLTGWALTFGDSSVFAIVSDAPTGGGRYSIALRTHWHIPVPSIITRAALSPGSHHYRLSCWAKRAAEGVGAIDLFLSTGSVDTLTASATVPVVDSIWTYYSTELVVVAQSGDSAIIAIQGGYSPISYPADSTFFDLCNFERID